MEGTKSMKRCTECLKEKPESKFGKRKDSKDGRKKKCFDCFNRYYRVWYKEKHKKQKKKKIVCVEFLRCTLCKEEYAPQPYRSKYYCLKHTYKEVEKFTFFPKETLAKIMIKCYD